MCAQGRTEKQESRDGRMDSMEEAVAVLGIMAPGSISEFSHSFCVSENFRVRTMSEYRSISGIPWKLPPSCTVIFYVIVLIFP